MELIAETEAPAIVNDAISPVVVLFKLLSLQNPRTE